MLLLIACNHNFGNNSIKLKKIDAKWTSAGTITLKLFLTHEVPMWSTEFHFYDMFDLQFVHSS